MKYLFPLLLFPLFTQVQASKGVTLQIRATDSLYRKKLCNAIVQVIIFRGGAPEFLGQKVTDDRGMVQFSFSLSDSLELSKPEAWRFQFLAQGHEMMRIDSFRLLNKNGGTENYAANLIARPLPDYRAWPPQRAFVGIVGLALDSLTGQRIPAVRVSFVQKGDTVCDSYTQPNGEFMTPLLWLSPLEADTLLRNAKVCAPGYRLADFGTRIVYEPSGIGPRFEKMVGEVVYYTVLLRPAKKVKLVPK